MSLEFHVTGQQQENGFGNVRPDGFPRRQGNYEMAKPDPETGKGAVL